MEDVGIEPTSAVLQTAAMTTSANPPIEETPNSKNQISTRVCIIEIWNLVLGIFPPVPRGGFEPAVADLKGRHPEPLDERGVTGFILLSTLNSQLRREACEGIEPSVVHLPVF